MKKIKLEIPVFSAVLLTFLIPAALAASGFFKGDPGIDPPYLTINERKWLTENEDLLTVSGDPDYPPIDFINKRGEPDGIANDIFRLIEARLDVRFKRVKFSNWSELLATAGRGKIDIIKCIVPSDERRKYLLFTEPYIEIPVVIFSRIDSGEKLSLGDLSGKKTAVSEGYYIHEILQNADPGIIILTAPNDGDALKRLSSGEADCAISDLPSASYFISRLGITNLRVAGETGLSYKLAIGSRKDLPVLNRILSKAAGSLTDQEKEIIYSRWIKIEYRKFLFSRNFWFLVSTIASMLIIMAAIYIFWSHSLRVLIKKRTRELDQYKDHLELLVAERTRELSDANRKLNDALANVKTLSGLLPICSGCKKIRNDEGYWEQIEEYIKNHSNADLSHGLCPDCAKKMYPEYFR